MEQWALSCESSGSQGAECLLSLTSLIPQALTGQTSRQVGTGSKPRGRVGRAGREEASETSCRRRASRIVRHPSPEACKQRLRGHSSWLPALQAQSLMFPICVVKEDSGTKLAGVGDFGQPYTPSQCPPIIQVTTFVSVRSIQGEQE